MGDAIRLRGAGYPRAADSIGLRGASPRSPRSANATSPRTASAIRLRGAGCPRTADMMGLRAAGRKSPMSAAAGARGGAGKSVAWAVAGRWIADGVGGDSGPGLAAGLGGPDTPGGTNTGGGTHTLGEAAGPGGADSSNCVLSNERSVKSLDGPLRFATPSEGPRDSRFL